MAKLQARGQGLRAESSRAAARSVCEVRREPGGKVSEGSVCSDIRQGLGWVRLGLLRASLPGTRAPSGLALDCQVSCFSPHGQRQHRLYFPCSSLVLGYWFHFWSFFPGCSGNRSLDSSSAVGWAACWGERTPSLSVVRSERVKPDAPLLWPLRL